MKKQVFVAVMIGAALCAASGLTIAGATGSTGPTTYQQFAPPTNQLTVNAAAGDVTIATTPLLPAGSYLVSASVQATANVSVNFFSCEFSTTGAKDKVQTDNGEVGDDLVTSPGTYNVNGNAAFGGTIVLKGAAHSVLVTCSDDDAVGATVAGWSVTEQPISGVVVN
jgi:hypothetical protein